VHESIQTALVPNVSQSLKAIKRLYVTRGGYAHQQVDKAGIEVLKALQKEIHKQFSELADPFVHLEANLLGGQIYENKDPAYRFPSPRIVLSIKCSTKEPSNAQTLREFELLVPADAAGDDDILVRTDKPPAERFLARLDEILPQFSGVLQMRLVMFTERILGQTLAKLRETAERKFRK
jgi:hypothetical protein